MHEVDTLSAVNAQLALLIKTLVASNVSAIYTHNSIYDSDGGGKTSEDCQVGNTFAFGQNEQANNVNNFQRSNNPYSNSYNPG